MKTDYMIKVAPLFVSAAMVTLKLTILSVLLSVFIGLINNVIIYFRLSFLTKLVKVYTEFSRNTPFLIQLFFLYFGLGSIGIRLSNLTCAIVGLAFLGGSYMTETIRAGIESVGLKQIEAAESLGLSPIQIMVYVVIPQSVKVSVPMILANVIFLLKETSICAVIAVPELYNIARDQIGMYYNTYECLLLLTASYLILIVPLLLLFRVIERRLQYD